MVVFAIIAIFSLVVLGILCNFTSITSAAGFYYQSFALGIATSLLTIIFIAASIVIDKFRRGAILSLVWFELAWMGLIWVLWLATAAAISALGIFTSCNFYNTEVESNCRQYQTVQAFSWLTWLLSFGWFTFVLVLSILAASRGHYGVWKMPITEHPGWSKAGPSPYGQYSA